MHDRFFKPAQILVCTFRSQLVV